jgi:hypothetical protein
MVRREIFKKVIEKNQIEGRNETDKYVCENIGARHFANDTVFTC